MFRLLLEKKVSSSKEVSRHILSDIFQVIMKKQKQQAYRHGEIMLLKIDKLPKGLELSNTKTFMIGSHGNGHSIDTGKLYLLKPKGGDFSFGYLVAKETSLLHLEHSPKVGNAKIKDGIYKLIKQTEFTPEGLIPVLD